MPHRKSALGRTSFQALAKIGENIPSILRGELNALDIPMRGDLLSQFYTETFGLQFYLRQLSKIAGQISNRFPHINIMELGKSHNASPFGLIAYTLRI